MSVVRSSLSDNSLRLWGTLEREARMWCALSVFDWLISLADSVTNGRHPAARSRPVLAVKAEPVLARRARQQLKLCMRGDPHSFLGMVNALNGVAHG
jgi:hypothetical protein